MAAKVKYQVFISSTYNDLVKERDQVIKAVLELGHIPVGMEMFSAADDDQWSVIARQIEEADYFIVILAQRYGSTALDGLGYTEKEYDYAVSSKVPVLGFILEEKATWPSNLAEKDRNLQKRLANFKSKVKKRLVRYWTDQNDLYAKVCTALVKAIDQNPRPGWIRSGDASAITGSLEANQFGVTSKLNVDIYYHERGFTMETANNLSSQLLRLGMSTRVARHVDGRPDAFFIGSLVTAAEVRAVLSNVNPKFLKYTYPSDYPDSEGGDLNGRRIGVGYTSVYNPEAHSKYKNAIAHPVSASTLRQLLNPKLTNGELHRLLFEITKPSE